jgi:tripartite-type tricarboxylate transporter receptor subunit TctC
VKRRTFSFAATGMVTTSMLCAPARAQEYPNRGIKIVTPIAPGGLADRVTRLMARHLSERVSQSVIVDNKPGAGGIIALDIVAKSPA